MDAPVRAALAATWRTRSSPRAARAAPGSDGEIRLRDRLRRLVGGQAAGRAGSTGLAENTAVVVMADHGEAWGEHKSFFHGQDLFDEQLRVPLIIAVPGTSASRVHEPVALVDVGPTLVDLVGAPMPAVLPRPQPAAGSMARSCRRRPLFSELLPATAWPHHAAMMVDDDKKLIHRVSEPALRALRSRAGSGGEAQPARGRQRRIDVRHHETRPAPLRRAQAVNARPPPVPVAGSAQSAPGTAG